MASLRIPVASYRLQMNGQLRFEDARLLVPYLHNLGITDLYLSPILQARSKSMHGYDVTDPTRLNSEIGSEEEFQALAGELRRLGMGVLLDIVPNHLVASIENPWWSDVLENGPSSAYAAYFDIDWHPPKKSLDNKLLLPILTRPYAEVLEQGELSVILEESGFYLRYQNSKLPLAPKSYARILEHRLEDFRLESEPEGPEFRELSGILAALAELPKRVALPGEIAGERRQRTQEVKERVWRLYNRSPVIRSFVDRNLRWLNGRRGKPAKFVPLDELLVQQAYVLSFWKSGNEEINYRRFSSIPDLVGVRVEDPLVFDAIHSTVLRLAESGAITGLRIDHIDGLRDPLGYLRWLQERLGAAEPEATRPGFYVVVEKILSNGETLPANWLVFGTTGYDFLNAVNRLFVDVDGLKSLESVYRNYCPAAQGLEDLIYEKKTQVMETILGVEMRSLAHRLRLLAEQDRYARDLSHDDLSKALAEVTACLRVYRTYARDFSMTSADHAGIQQAIEAARRRNPSLAPECLAFVGDVLHLRPKPHLSSGQTEANLDFVMRWQQFSGPIMAKGFEDTALYTYNPLASLNEVGSAFWPDMSLDAFHDFCRSRKREWPDTLNATSTHDTKRSEDVRARLNVLSELAGAWKEHLTKWTRWNAAWKTKIEGQAVPDTNEEILLYQTMLGAWPLDESEVCIFQERLQEFMVKAAREAKIHTQWEQPDNRHEKSLCRFIDAIVKRSRNNRFLADFLRFQRTISFHGALNSLAQVMIKIGAPGTPDFYQGSELWAFRLVDPDNRGTVDFEKRIRALAQLRALEAERGPAMIRELLDRWEDGHIKLFLVERGLHFRKKHARLFQDGEYIPLKAAGQKGENVCAFLRNAGKSWALIAVPRFTTRLTNGVSAPLGKSAWGSSALPLEDRVPRVWKNTLTGETVSATAARHQASLPLAALFSHFPVALLQN